MLKKYQLKEDRIKREIEAFGESEDPAEKHYVSYIFRRLKGESVEEVMGISEILKSALRGFQGKGKYKNLKKIKWH